MFTSLSLSHAEVDCNSTHSKRTNLSQNVLLITWLHYITAKSCIVLLYQ